MTGAPKTTTRRNTDTEKGNDSLYQYSARPTESGDTGGGHATEIRERPESLHANRRSGAAGAVQGAEVGGSDSEQMQGLCKCREDTKGRGGGKELASVAA